MTKHYNFQARVSENNVPEKDFKFLEKEIQKGVNMTALAHEALTALRKLRNGDLIEINKLNKFIKITENKPKKEVAVSEPGILGNKLLKSINGAKKSLGGE